VKTTRPKRTTTAPDPNATSTTPAPLAVPVSCSLCCDATVTFPQSPAFQFYPAAYTPSSFVVGLSNGTILRPGWTDARLTYSYDPTKLMLTFPSRRPATFTVLSARYTGPFLARITVSFKLNGMQTNASVVLTIVDVRNVTLSGPGPDAVLYRLYCSSAFQSVAFRLSAFIDTIGDVQIPSTSFNLTSTRPDVASTSGATAVGLAQGVTDVIATWWGFKATYRNLTVLNASVTYVDAYSPPYIFVGSAGQILPLSLSLGQLLPGAPGAMPSQPVLLPSPGFVAVLPPPSVRLTPSGDALYSVSNSPGLEFVTFQISTCGADKLAYQASVLVNLAPGPYDVDIGADGAQLALVAGIIPAPHPPAACTARSRVPASPSCPAQSLGLVTRSQGSVARVSPASARRSAGCARRFPCASGPSPARHRSVGA
jgi:hypothetical protein